MNSQKDNRLRPIQTNHGVSYPVVGAVAQPDDDEHDKEPEETSAKSDRSEKTTAAL
ncbi:hypothetical protein FF011L_26900 [Roseimaritima multifibrata]|uniref:Uncharacterized protein n=1 Tax=Roseimaritima multifibrata TaxID=1930274 RepID=A0A517MG96_9BACT|nr:hypothetical protein [Roseimaritima multifibrata]QDS93913.1 hypothetical protein FF011L_26900 [Roseimaritima multifibrata]